MKFFTLIITSLMFSAPSFAQEPIEDLIQVDGSSIDEPVLEDYEYATRTPGFSPITEIVDINGEKVSP